MFSSGSHLFVTFIFNFSPMCQCVLLPAWCYLRHSLSSSSLMHRYVCTWNSSSCQAVQPKSMSLWVLRHVGLHDFSIKCLWKTASKRPIILFGLSVFTDTSMFVLQHLQVFHLEKYNPVKAYLLFYIALQGGAEITPVFRPQSLPYE